MKHLLSVFIILCTLSTIGQPRIDSLKSNTGDTLTIKKFNKKGKLTWEKHLVNGEYTWFKSWYYMKDGYGYYLSYYRQDTIIKPKIVYRKEFYLNGQAKIVGQNIKSKKHGKYITYYEDGQIQCDCNYNNGKRVGNQIGYHENGEISFAGTYGYGDEDGKITYYHDNGQIWSKRTYKEGNLWNVISNFDRNGNPVDKGTLIDGNGTLKIYSVKGELQKIITYKNGKKKKTKKSRKTHIIAQKT